MNIKLYSTEKATARTLNIAISEGLSRIFHKKLSNTFHANNYTIYHHINPVVLNNQ